MATTYTDVDRLILDRWQDVCGLRDAFDELQDRIQAVIEEVGGRLERWGTASGYRIETRGRDGSYFGWKNSWENKKRDAAMYFYVSGVTPTGYRKVDVEHPHVWFNCEEFDSLRLKEAEREDFVRQLRARLGDYAAAWINEDTTEDEPLGRYFLDVTEADRVAMISDPDRLYAFVVRAFEEAFTLADAIDEVLARFRA